VIEFMDIFRASECIYNLFALQNGEAGASPFK
jgi:hypothetical protein